MDQEIAKNAQKILKKQGLIFKLNTKVMAGEVSEQGIKVNVEAAKGGKAETVSSLLAITVAQPHDRMACLLTTLFTARGRRLPCRHRPSPLHRRSWLREDRS